MNAPVHMPTLARPKASVSAARPSSVVDQATSCNPPLYSPPLAQGLGRGQGLGGQGVGTEMDSRQAGWDFARIPVHADIRREGAFGTGQGGGRPRPPAAPPAGTCPTNITFSTGNQAVHVPPCGANVTANTTPANIPGITWSLNAGSAQLAAGTAINAAGEITFGAAQTGGTVSVRADQAAAAGGGTCFATQDLSLHSHPLAITSTFVVGPPAAAATNYGAVFDHNFTSADGKVTSLENVAVGEQFDGVPNPTATVHLIQGTPFGDFTLNTANLTPGATNNWFINNGSLGGNHDTITIGRAAVNVGQFLPSASNPTPVNTLPASFTVKQGLHWFCRQAPAASRWTKFIELDHVRTLRLDATGTGVEFVISDNNIPNVDAYTGHPAIINAHAAAATIPPTAARARGAPAPTPSTTTITADSRPDPLPAGHQLRFSIQGPALGCRVNATTGLFTAGTQTGTVTVRVRDSIAANPNFDEVVVTIAAPAPQPAPAQPAPGQPTPGQLTPGQPTPGQTAPGQPGPTRPVLPPAPATAPNASPAAASSGEEGGEQ